MVKAKPGYIISRKSHGLILGLPRVEDSYASLYIVEGRRESIGAAEIGHIHGP